MLHDYINSFLHSYSEREDQEYCCFEMGYSAFRIIFPLESVYIHICIIFTYVMLMCFKHVYLPQVWKSFYNCFDIYGAKTCHTLLKQINEHCTTMLIKKKYFRLLNSILQNILKYSFKRLYQSCCSNTFSHLCPNITGINSDRYLSKSNTTLELKF